MTRSVRFHAVAGYLLLSFPFCIGFTIANRKRVPIGASSHSPRQHHHSALFETGLVGENGDVVAQTERSPTSSDQNGALGLFSQGTDSIRRMATSSPLVGVILSIMVSSVSLAPPQHAMAATLTSRVTSTSTSTITAASTATNSVPAEKRALNSAKTSLETTTARLVQMGKDIETTKSDNAKALRAINKEQLVADRAHSSFDLESRKLESVKKSDNRQIILMQKHRADDAKGTLEVALEKLTASKNVQKNILAKLEALRSSFRQTEKTIQKAIKDVETAEKKYSEYQAKYSEYQAKTKKRDQEIAAKERKQAEKEAEGRAKEESHAAQRKVQTEHKKAEEKKKRLEKETKLRQTALKDKAEAQKKTVIKASHERQDKIKGLRAKIGEMKETRGDLILADARASKIDKIEQKLEKAQNELRLLQQQ